MSEPQTGDVLGGKYRIERVLGEGGMGLVVQATHLALDQKVAIKFLKTDALLHPEIVERFKREARASVRVRGPHVARVIDVDQTPDGRPFMVMEYMNGEDLSVVLEQRGALSVEEAATYVLQACDAIAEAHAAKIIHRDIKPANLFLAHGEGRRPMVKVLDFGISKLQDPQGGLTQTLAILGSPHYMSPEQLRASKNVDERADIWSLGVTLYELLTGTRPFEAETLPEIITAIVLNEVPKVRTIRPDVPEAVEEIVSRCMKQKPDERYQNVAELARALEPFAEPSAKHLANGISRMLLGVTVPPPREPSAAPVLEIIAPPSQSSPPPPPAPTGLPISTAVTMVGPASGAATTGAMSAGGDRASDLVTEQPRSGRGIYVLGIAAAFVALGVGFFAIRGTQTTSAAPLPSVTPPPFASAEPKLDPLPTAPPTPPTVASSPIEPPVPSAPASAPQSTHASVGAKPPPSARATTAAPPPSSAPTNTPTVVATAPTPPPSSTATSAPASTTTQPPKNPLQMGLK